MAEDTPLLRQGLSQKGYGCSPRAWAPTEGGELLPLVLLLVLVLLDAVVSSVLLLELELLVELLSSELLLSEKETVLVEEGGRK